MRDIIQSQDKTDPDGIREKEKEKMEKTTWYAVQVGDNFAWDEDGAWTLEEAKKIAEGYLADRDHDGEEIRIAVIDTVASFCDDEIIIREGTR